MSHDMNKIILVAGATGNLGNRICRELVQRPATVRAVVRLSSDHEKVQSLREMGVDVYEIDMNDVDTIAKASIGVNCVISAVAGLKEVIVDLQKRILDAAVMAGVPRFIPSDFCTDYTDLVPGENRNFDLRREFRAYLDRSPIKAASVFNGAFADILKYNTPVLNLKEKSIGYWGNKADWKLDFTSMNDTAAFTAEAALDDDAPRNLRIAGFQISPDMLRATIQDLTGQQYKIHQISGLEEFANSIKKLRAENPAGENELYARWQQAQYMYSMFSTQHSKLDNGRYQNLSWTSALDYLRSFVK